MNFIKKLFLGKKACSESYIKHLRKIGVEIGERTVFYDARSCHVDETRPFLIKIGENVQITRGVTILTHGYDWSVLKNKNGVVLGSGGKVIIGNNVFIGAHTTILKGVEIGNDVIIGANSLVNKSLESGFVYAGNPVKKICSIDEYFNKRKGLQVKEAKDIYDCYVERFGKEPPMEIFAEFFWLFWKREDPLPQVFSNVMALTGNFAESMESFTSMPPQFNGYEEFLSFLKGEKYFGNVYYN